MAKKKNPINVLGVKLKMAREARNLSQEEVAIKLAELGITVRDIEDFEKGFDIPSEKALTGLSELYRINLNELLNLKRDIEIARAGTNNYQRKKFVGKTFWDVFGDFIMTLVKIAILGAILFYLIKSGVFGKLKDLVTSDNNETEENYIVDDEYLRMLNSNRGANKDYLNETGKH